MIFNIIIVKDKILLYQTEKNILIKSDKRLNMFFKRSNWFFNNFIIHNRFINSNWIWDNKIFYSKKGKQLKLATQELS